MMQNDVMLVIKILMRQLEATKETHLVHDDFFWIVLQMNLKRSEV